jgi:hypothetical protein
MALRVWEAWLVLLFLGMVEERVLHRNDVMRVDPLVVIELESRRPIGLGDLMKEPIREEEPI